jgi:hypothetical protein
MQTTTMLLTQYAQAAQAAQYAAQVAQRNNTLMQLVAQAIAQNAQAAQAAANPNNAEAYITLFNAVKAQFVQQYIAISNDEELLIDALFDEIL